jgi:hypothetical protein
MRLDLKLNSLWRFFRAKAARVNRVLSDAQDDDMIFQVHSWGKKLLERFIKRQRRRTCKIGVARGIAYASTGSAKASNYAGAKGRHNVY